MRNNLRPIHPGEILRGELEEMGLSARAMAKALSVPVNRITAILNEKRAVTADTALRLARFFGGTPEFWLNLQSAYELRRTRMEAGKRIDREVRPRHAACLGGFAESSMRAMAVHTPGPIETNPLSLVDIAPPEPGPGEILVRVKSCGVCRTDLHVAEGDLKPKHPRIIPGHEVVGVVEGMGAGCRRFKPGVRVGIAWLRETCGVCAYCRRERENLCPNARFTGWDHDGGYAEFATVREDFAYPIPDLISDQNAAPLLCAGIIGFRAIKRAEVRRGSTVGLYGFGGSAHLAIQVLKYWGCRVFVMSRGGIHQELAEDLGAQWVGSAEEHSPAPLDAAILFAPAGNLVLPAMEALDRGGILAIAGIYLTPVPALDYERHLFYEKEIRSVTANTRADGEEFLRISGEIPIRTHTVPMALEDANRALNMLKHDELKGAAVLHVALPASSRRRQGAATTEPRGKVKNG